jgi:hypothetical protein
MRSGLVKQALFGVLAAAVIFGPRAVAEYYAPGEAGVIAILSFFLVPMALLGVLGSLILIGFRSVRRPALKVLVPSLAFLLASVGVLRLQGEARSLAFEQLAERSRLLIEAITRYEIERGEPPRSLASLVPHYLDEIPGTGIEAYPEYDYEVFAERVAWYDLGTRGGADYEGDWKYAEGDPEHAILLFLLRGEGTVFGVVADRLASGLEKGPFDPVAWARSGPHRMTMAGDLVATLQPIGRPFSEITQVLGQPSGSPDAYPSRWELRVHCSIGFLNWDMFIYWPTEDYPDGIYGGAIERIADWAYVHE